MMAKLPMRRRLNRVWYEYTAVGGADIIDMLHPPDFFGRFFCLFMPHTEDSVERPYDTVLEQYRINALNDVEVVGQPLGRTVGILFAK